MWNVKILSTIAILLLFLKNCDTEGLALDIAFFLCLHLLCCVVIWFFALLEIVIGEEQTLQKTAALFTFGADFTKTRGTDFTKTTALKFTFKCTNAVFEEITFKFHHIKAVDETGGAQLTISLLKCKKCR